MRRLLIVSAVTFLSFASQALAGGGEVGDAWRQFWSNTKRDWHRNNCWPDPFVYPDRASTVAPLALQVSNGWRMQNLVGEYYFDNRSHQLTAAGRDRVRWIVTQAPAQFRTVFVQRGNTPDQTAMRVDSIQKFAAEMFPTGELPAVVDTNLQPRGWPADYINTVYSTFEKSTPSPRLPESGMSGTN
jgi:hypothetical protein